ncbi:glycosyltransferase family 2 protein [Roseateles sp. L2-2]|uniref:glycosyltransferase family 2 protein n=1 Tax=Roseateles sp. L2-2 TaxID=3422597 RepID=UPI003D369A9E
MAIPSRSTGTPVASVVFTTYNQPAWLRLALLGFAAQDRSDFELIVADDGSGPETRAVIEALRPQLPVYVRHVWQPDDGFRKCRILNAALRLVSSDYVIVTDGDCVPRADFVSTHLRLREARRFLSGGYFKLPMQVSQAVSAEAIASGQCFSLSWLYGHGLPRTIRSWRLGVGRGWGRVLDRIVHCSLTWNGHNASGWLEDILRVNGFDERMGYGAEDVEMGDRLYRSGVTGKRIRYRTPVLHLDHPRGYDQPEIRAMNKRLRERGREEHLLWTPHGIAQLSRDSPPLLAPSAPP